MTRVKDFVDYSKQGFRWPDRRLGATWSKLRPSFDTFEERCQSAAVLAALHVRVS
jgi:hypothetical protein